MCLFYSFKRSILKRLFFFEKRLEYAVGTVLAGVSTPNDLQGPVLTVMFIIDVIDRLFVLSIKVVNEIFILFSKYNSNLLEKQKFRIHSKKLELTILFFGRIFQSIRVPLVTIQKKLKKESNLHEIFQGLFF